MAITRVSGPKIIAQFPQAQISLEWDSYTLARLENGRMAATFETMGSGTASTLHVTTLDALGDTHSNIVTLDTTANGRALEDPSIVSAGNGNFLVAWTNGSTSIDLTKSDAHGRVYGSGGNALGPKFHFSTSASDGEMLPSVAQLGNGNFFAAWSDTRGAPLRALDADIMGRVYSSNGGALTGEFKINVSSSGFQFGTQSMGLADGRTLVVWHHGVRSGVANFSSVDLRGRFLSADGKPMGGEIVIDKIGANRNYHPERTELVQLGDGGFVAVWEEYVGAITDPSAKEIHLQRFTAAGVKAGGELLVDAVPHNWSFQWISPVELANGGFAIAWRTFDPSDDPGKLLARVFDINGVEVGTETEITPIASAGGGLKQIIDFELMSNGQVMGLGEITDGTNISFGTQIFDFGDARLMGTAKADVRYGKNGVADQIFGLGGGDTLKGLGGADVIDGGGGRDTMTGGAGADRFVFSSATATGNTPTTRDIITDFAPGIDRIDLSPIDADGAGASHAFTFLAGNGAAFTGAAGQLRWFQQNPAGTVNDKTIVEGDINGDAVADFQIELTGLKSLSAADFIL